MFESRVPLSTCDLCAECINTESFVFECLHYLIRGRGLHVKLFVVNVNLSTVSLPKMIMFSL